MDPDGRGHGIIYNHPVARDLSFLSSPSASLMMVGGVGVKLLALVLSVALLVDVAMSDTYGHGAEDKSSEEVHNFPVKELPPLAYRPKRYHLYPESVDFFEAWRSCMRKGKSFATIESLTDHESFRETMIKAGPLAIGVGFWIAGTNAGASKHERDDYYWITNDRPVSFLNGYQNWVGYPTGEPRCIFAYAENNLWGYASCSSVGYYACEDESEV